MEPILMATIRRFPMSLSTSRFARVALGVVAMALVLGGTATAAQASTTDAPSTYSAVKVTSAQNTWLSGALPKTTDVDTYRFTTTTSAYARILLGDLGADYRLRLLDRSGHRLKTSDRPG